MMKLDQVLNTFGLMGFREVATINFKPNGAEIVLTSGETLLFTVPSVKPAPVEYQEVAYFTYPSSDGGMRLSRRVIVYDGGSERTPLLRGYETSNEANYKFKAFRVERMRGLQIRSEVITAEDKKNLVHL